MAPPSTWPMGWCGGQCSSSGTWRCTRVLAATPWRASEGAGVWRTAPGRRLPHAEVERTLCLIEGTLPFSQDTSCFIRLSPFAHDAAPLLSFLTLHWTAPAHRKNIFFWRLLTSPCLFSLSSNASFYASCMCTVCGSRGSYQDIVAIGSFICRFLTTS